MIEYKESVGGVSPKALQGFFVGWSKPHTPEAHLAILTNSDHVVLAMDTEQQRVVGFITAITDQVQSAYIPLLEVLPDYQSQGIGTELVERMFKKLEAMPAIDLTCDAELQSFYSRFGMRRSVGMLLRRY